jgi:hypothetical protein
MKHLVAFYFLAFTQLVYSQQRIYLDPESRKDVANVFWKKNYTLFDLMNGEPIFPVNENGRKIYKIYYSSNEDRNPYYGEFTPDQLTGHLFYKFKSKETCEWFCSLNKATRDPEPRKDVANVFWKSKYTLFDLITDQPIFPVYQNGRMIYKIYYSSNEDPSPYYGEFTADQLTGHLYYKFKDRESCEYFCNTRKIRRDPDKRKDYVNVFWKKQYTLFDLMTDEAIIPIQINGRTVYKIYYSSNEDRNPYYGEFTPDQLTGHLYYKFKTLESCMKFCSSK